MHCARSAASTRALAHFDDWAAWIRFADRIVLMCRTTTVVAECRLHDGRLSAQVLHVRAMKARILAMFDRLASTLTAGGTRAIARIVIAGRKIHDDDDSASALKTAQQAFHESARCLGPRLSSHASQHARRSETLQHRRRSAVRAAFLLTIAIETITVALMS
jgi:hypothetical protein